MTSPMSGLDTHASTVCRKFCRNNCDASRPSGRLIHVERRQKCVNSVRYTVWCLKTLKTLGTNSVNYNTVRLLYAPSLYISRRIPCHSLSVSLINYKMEKQNARLNIITLHTVFCTVHYSHSSYLFNNIEFNYFV